MASPIVPDRTSPVTMPVRPYGGLVDAVTGRRRNFTTGCGGVARHQSVQDMTALGDQRVDDVLEAVGPVEHRQRVHVLETAGRGSNDLGQVLA